MADLWDDGAQLVGRWDGEARVFLATGWTYGPAGPASVELAPGLRFAVDFANPDVTTEITIETPLDGDPTRLDPRVERAARMLLGPPTLRALVALADPGAPDRAVTIVEASRREELSVGMQRRALGRFALLAEMTTDARASRFGAAIAGLEAAGVAPSVDPGMGVMLGPARALARDAAETLLGLADTGEIGPWTFGPGSDLAEVVRSAIPVLGDETLARRLTGLTDAAGRAFAREDRRRVRLSAPSAVLSGVERLDVAATSAAMRDDGERSVEVDDDAAPGTAAVLAGTELRVRSPRAAGDGRWARVFRRRGGLLLALAPMRANDLGLDALLVVPPGLGAHDLVVDVTEAPGAPRPSATLAALRAAVAAGREACRLDRLGDTAGAALRWSECADRWAAVGDDRRRALARGYATGERTARRPGAPAERGLPVQPFVADALV